MATDDPSGRDSLYGQAAAEYGWALERLCYGYEADPDRRQDLLQDIHVQLWRSFEVFDGRCSLRTWTYRVAHNVAVSHMIRRSKAPVLLTLEQAAEFAGDMADRRKALDRLLALVRDLDVLDRQVILSYLEGLDAEQISELTGISKVNVWTKIHRIKCILAKKFWTPVGGNR